MTVYVLTSAKDVAAVLKNTTDFTFDRYLEDMMNSFGATQNGIRKMWQPPSTEMQTSASSFPNPQGKNLAHLAEAMIRHQLCTGAKLKELQKILLQSIFNSVSWGKLDKAHLVCSKPESYRVSLAQWTRDALLGVATRAFFGEALLRQEPHLLENFFDFDDLSWKLSYKVPRPWSNDMHRLRLATQSALTRYFEMPLQFRDDACWLVKSLEYEMRMRNVGSEDIAVYLLMIYWVYVTTTSAFTSKFLLMKHVALTPTLGRSASGAWRIWCINQTSFKECATKSPLS